ncbi:receptor-like protein kinase HERK 1 isoform X2 [Helianthus annuus]|uniref:receptor-like protein kinase HERK 1 isoform X2 n=1 Tax=Helianthus annuus TaxID=4232 RepID=UPI001652FCE7|nr:receptor-like protein kinase HERK 1 isoform X2 [Helianthus annuus]
MAQIQELDHLKIPLQDIKLATNNFAEDNFIGTGGFGRVYKGQLPNDHSIVAIKRLDNTITPQGPREFALEIIVLASYKHTNLTSLVGFCDDDGEKILMYEYVTNGSLENHLASVNLTWEQRLRICLGAASGLDYLHGGLGTSHRAIHGNIKSSNILLDVNREAKISDFGMSNIGHMIDSVLCRRPAVMAEYHDERKFLRKVVKRCYEEEKLDEIIMDDLREQMKPYSLEIFSTAAYQCLNKDRKQRPSMKSIVQELRSSFEYQIGSPTKLWGSSTGGSPWSLLLDNNMKLRKIAIDHEDWIFSIGFTVEDVNGLLIFSQHGGTGGDNNRELYEINFDADEEIIGMLGTIGVTTGYYAGYQVISSLCIVTNKRRYGPFGEETMTRFRVPWDVGSFAGFYGRAGFYLDGLGFYSKNTI